MILSGSKGKAVYKSIRSPLFVFGHPALGNWDDLDDLYKQESGLPAHVFGGVTPKASKPMRVDDGEGGTRLATVEEFEARHVFELYVEGEIVRWNNDGPTSNVVMEMKDAKLADAVDAKSVRYRDDKPGAVPTELSKVDLKITKTKTMSTVSCKKPKAIAEELGALEEPI